MTPCFVFTKSVEIANTKLIILPKYFSENRKNLLVHYKVEILFPTNYAHNVIGCDDEKKKKKKHITSL